MHKLDEAIQHAGVKGMRWGVRRDRNRPGGADGKLDAKDIRNPKTLKGKIIQKTRSLKREREWNKVLKELDTLSTKDINTVTKRIGLENSLKTLSKERFATSKDKRDYLNRADMSDQELSRKVNRLRAKEGLHKAVSAASKEQRELGEKVVQIASSVGVKYALNRGTITPKDLFDTAMDAKKNPKDSYNKSREDVLNRVTDPKTKWLVEKGLKEYEKKWQVKSDKK